MIGMRSGLGQKTGPVVADPGAVGVLTTGAPRRRKPPKNIRGLASKKKKKPGKLLLK